MIRMYLFHHDFRAIFMHANAVLGQTLHEMPDISSPHSAIKIWLQCRKVIFSGPETQLKQALSENGIVEVAGILL